MSKKLTPKSQESQETEQSQSSKLEFGNLDKDKKHNIAKLKVPANHYVVRHFGTVKLANGQDMEDPTSSRLQVYDIRTFDAMSKQSTKDGKQQLSQFEKLGLNVDVLHDPTV